jgi:membrane protease YdiL (CAAX protease family)
VSIFSLLFIGLQLIVLPVLSFQSRSNLEESEEIPPRQALYLQSIIMLTAIGGLAALVDWRETLEIHWFSPFTGPALGLAGGIYLAGLLVNFINYRMSKEKEDKSAQMLPETKKEYLLWIFLCFTAAWAEEYIYRGVLTHLLSQNGMVFILAALLSAVSFSFSHFTQGWLAIPVTFVFALGFQFLYAVSGSLVLPFLVHFLYNISAEWVRKWLIRPVK